MYPTYTRLFSECASVLFSPAAKMKKVFLLLVLRWTVGIPVEKNNADDLQTHNSKGYYQYITPATPFSDTDSDNSQKSGTYGFSVVPLSNIPLLHPVQISKVDNHHNNYENPLLAALLLSTYLGLSTKNVTPNNPELVPINPYIALLLSHYGKYIPHQRIGKGLYGYTASNNFHNNLPFGSYKVYEPYTR